MARTSKTSLPNYPKSEHNGQARVTVRLTTGRRHDINLGLFNSDESRTEYRRLLALLESNAGRYPVTSTGAAVASGLTLNEIALEFARFACDHYRLADGSPSRELEHYKSSLNPLLDLYGTTLGSEFRPCDFKAVRTALIKQIKYRVRFTDSPPCEQWRNANSVQVERSLALKSGKWKPIEIIGTKPSLSRKVINQRMDHIKRFFLWAATEELLPLAVHAASNLVSGLRRGYPGTRDTAKVKPVPETDVAKTLPYLLPQVQTMVQLQCLMGARPSEISLMRGRNIFNRDQRVWRLQIDPGAIETPDSANSRIANISSYKFRPPC